MSKGARYLAYLLAAKLQIITYFVLAYYGGEWLTKSKPMGFDWHWILFLVAAVLSIHTIVVFIRGLLKWEKSLSREAQDKPTAEIFDIKDNPVFKDDKDRGI